VEDPAANETSQSGGYPPRIGEEKYGIEKTAQGTKQKDENGDILSEVKARGLL